MKIIKKIKNKQLTYDKISSFSDFHTYINSISTNKFFLGIKTIFFIIITVLPQPLLLQVNNDIKDFEHLVLKS